MGTFAKDTYPTASKAALVGGTTTLIEMCCPARQETRWKDSSSGWPRRVGKSACDFTLPHGRDANLTSERRSNFAEIVKRGISSFKIFLAYKGALGIDDAELYRTLRLAKELGVIVTAHCENETLIAERQQELLAAGKTDPGSTS